MASSVEEEDERPLPTSVQEMIEMAGEPLLSVPQAFIRPPHDRPPPPPHDPVLTASLAVEALPIIDIAGLCSPHLRPLVLRHIALACANWGFFQVTNHSVPEEVMEEMKAACLRFFNQPANERNKLKSRDFKAPVAYMTSFNPSKEVARDWKDVLYVRDMPGVCCNGFEVVPDTCREAFQEYRKRVEELANMLYEAIFESLGLSSAFVKEALPPIPRVVMAVNYYPPCPDPGLTYGLSSHSDVGSLTILLQDDVPGLQIKKGSGWYSVKPVANALLINLADQIEIMSNGRYKSIEHRVITNLQRPRLSVACFFNPNGSDSIGPLPNLVSEDEPALYKEVKFQEYIENFHSGVLVPNKGYLNVARQ